MGSVGVQTGGGRITRDQVVSLRDAINMKSSERGVLGKEFAKANSLVVFPDAYTTSDTVKKSMREWEQRLGLGSASRGFAVSMTGASVRQKRNLGNALNSAYNLPQNSDERYEKRAADLTNDALAWARSHGRTGLTNIERRAVAEIARSMYQRSQIEKMIAKDRENGGRLYGGNISTRNLTKADFKKHSRR